MYGDPVRWRALRVALYCAAIGVAAIVIEQRTSLHGTHVVVGVSIKDQERTLLGDAGIALCSLSALLALSAFMEPVGLTRSVSGPTALLAIVTLVGGALVFSAYRVQQNALHKHSRTPPVVQVDCPLKGGTCFNVTGQGGTYPGPPPSGADPINNCTWSDVGKNAAHTEEIYDCR